MANPETSIPETYDDRLELLDPILAFDELMHEAEQRAYELGQLASAYLICTDEVLVRTPRTYQTKILKRERKVFEESVIRGWVLRESGQGPYGYINNQDKIDNRLGIARMPRILVEDGRIVIAPNVKYQPYEHWYTLNAHNAFLLESGLLKHPNEARRQWRADLERVERQYSIRFET